MLMPYNWSMNRAEFIGCLAQQEAKARALATCSEKTDFEAMQAEAIKLAETTPLNLLETWHYVNAEVARVGVPMFARDAIHLAEKLNLVRRA